MEVITIKTTTNSALDLELKKCYPFSVFHYGFGILLFISGFILAINLWPEHPLLETTFKCKPLDYLPSLISFTVGFFSCILFSTVARFLSLIQIQNITIRHIATELDRQGLELDRERERHLRNLEQTKSFIATEHGLRE
ncbi:MAG TPA: hypothetical protein VHR47_10545 [Bacillota bacterium]|nr:hypothetical protein [Bacillota bacterium]